MGASFSEFAGLPVPDGQGTDDLSYWLSQLVAGLDTAVVMKASSNADRDSRFYLAPAGSICVVVSGSTVSGVYVKTSAPGTAVWGTVWQPQSPITWTPLVLASNVSQWSTPPSITLSDDNRWGTLRGDVQTVSSAAFVNATLVATIPPPFIVDESVKIPVAFNQVGSSGVAVGYLYVSSADNSCTLYGINPATMQPQWAALWGVRFACHK